MPNTTDPALRVERFFIVYDDVIKSIRFGIIKYLLKNKSRYEEYLDYSFIENKTDQQLLGWLSSISYKNILITMAKTEFDYEESYKSMIDDCDDIFESSMLLDIGKSIPILASQSFT